MRGRQLFVLFTLCSAIVAAGCSNSRPSVGSTGGGGTMMGGPNGSSASSSTSNGNGNGNGGMMGGPGSAGSYSSVGQRIYLTGVGADSQPIAHSDPPVSRSSYIMMSSAGCASCHDRNGRGGTIRKTNGTLIKAPDITHSALIRRGFTDAAIRKAIGKGLDEKGQPLDEAMPRWQMSSADLDATIAYLILLSAK